MPLCCSRALPNLDQIVVNDGDIELVSETKLLGVVFTDDPKWQAHTNVIVSRASQRLYLLTLLRRAGVDQTSLVDIYISLVRSVTEYACQIWHPGLIGAN